MPRVRPTEHRAVVQLLNDPADSVEDLATEVILKIDSMRAQRKDYIVVVYDPGVGVHVHGPYVTKNAAHKDIGKNVYAASEGAYSLVLPLINGDEGIEGID
jgi:hypothetical protein